MEMENNIGWESNSNGSGGSGGNYDDTIIKNQIRVLGEELDTIEDTLNQLIENDDGGGSYDDTTIRNQIEVLDSELDRLNEGVIFDINGKLPINNSVLLQPEDIGAVRGDIKTISDELPCLVGSGFNEGRAIVYPLNENGDDVIVVRSVNDVKLGESNISVEKCGYEIIDEGREVIITTNSSATSWSKSYVEVRLDGLEPNTLYKIHADFSQISGYASGNSIQGIYLYTQAISAITLSSRVYQYGKDATFTSPSDGIVRMRIYPSATGYEDNEVIKCSMKNLMICRSDIEVDMTEFYPYHRNEYTLENGKDTTIDIRPNAYIETINNLYNNDVRIDFIQGLSKVFRVNGYEPDNFGNVSIPKSLIDGKEIVFFGDSITEFGEYNKYITEMTGAITYNVGVGGTRMSRHSNEGYDAFSMTKLADAIVSGDFTLQDAGIIEMRDGNGDDNSKALATLKSINFNNVDYIVIGFGTNDFSGNISIGDDNSAPGNTTYRGAIKYIIEKLNTAFPHIQLLFISPIYRWRINDGVNDSDENGIEGKMLVEYADALAEECCNLHTLSLHLYNESGINKFNYAYYLDDGVHPTEAGYRLLASKVAKCILSKM